MESISPFIFVFLFFYAIIAVGRFNVVLQHKNKTNLRKATHAIFWLPIFVIFCLKHFILLIMDFFKCVFQGDKDEN